MTDLQEVLGDASDNDKLLIKELSICIKNHRDKVKIINKSFFKDILDITLSNYKDISVSKIVFNEVLEKGDLSEASAAEDYLSFCINNIIYNYYYGSFNDFKNLSDMSLRGYFEIVNTIVHEITHLKQFSLGNKGIIDYSLMNYLSISQEELYLKYYYSIYFERYANLRGTLMAYDALSYIYSDKIMSPYKKFFLSELLSGYTFSFKKINEGIKSPNQIFNDALETCGYSKVNIPFAKDDDLYTRLYLGNNITLDEFRKVENLILNENRLEGLPIRKLLK